MNTPIKILLFSLLFLVPSSMVSAGGISPEKDLCSKAYALGKKEEKAGYNELLDLYMAANSRENQLCILEQLSNVDKKRSVSYFTQQLLDGKAEVKAKAAYALGYVQDPQSAEPLRSVLQEKDEDLVCEASLALGYMGDKDAIPMLAKLVEKENPQIAGCAIEALSAYGDKGFCQDYFEIWLSKRDDQIRKDAGFAFIINDCSGVVDRDAKLAMDSKTCGYTQFFINTVRDAIVKTPEKDLKEVLKELDIKETIIDKDTPEEIIQMRLNLVFSVMDWGETVSEVNSIKDLGSLKENKTANLDKIENWMFKEEFVKQFCPIISFPDFPFWNSVIDGSVKEKK